LATSAKNKDRALAQGRGGEDIDADPDDDVGLDEGVEVEEDGAMNGSKVVVIHPGSQNLRIGLGSDALPKVVPMVIARKWRTNESEEAEPLPKRIKLDNGRHPEEPEKMYGPEFANQYNQMCADLKVHMRANKRRVLPNSKELVVNYNSRIVPGKISEHNDPKRVDWTEIPRPSPDYITGKEALRIPDASNPRYRLFWPLQRGWYNEADYEDKTQMHNDIATIIEEAIKSQLGLLRKKEWSQYGCVFIIPDLYERNYVIRAMEMIIRDFGFNKVCFMQESLGATFGAGTSISCVVDIGAQKTSICCVEEGMCLENSRVNLKMGGADVTELFLKMMLFDHFPYADINLRRRYDSILAEELKSKFCTMNESDITVQPFDFYLRAPGQETRQYAFKTYDEVLLAPQGIFQPSIFDHSQKLRGRRKLVTASSDLYDGSPNDPVSAAQTEIVQRISPAPQATSTTDAVFNGAVNGNRAFSTPMKQAQNPFSRLQNEELLSSAAGSPAPEGDDTPAAEPSTSGNVLATSIRDDILPVTGLDTAIVTSIEHGARGDEKKYRDFAGGIMVVGGGSQVSGLLTFLEERLKLIRPAWASEFLVTAPPRELDARGVVWKGGSIFAKLRSTNEVWIGRTEFDCLGSRALAYKCMWAW